MKRFMKKAIAAALTATMLFANVLHVSANTDGTHEMSAHIPIRLFFEAIGAEVNWAQGQVIISMPGGDEWTLTPGAANALLNSEEIQLNSPIAISDSRAMISFDDAAVLFAGTSEFPQTVTTAALTAIQAMEAAGVTGLTMALVDAQTGYTWTQGLGFADSINNIIVDEHTLFQVGSSSKPFTAVAVMQLVEQGIIDLDEPIVTYIPEFSLLPGSILGGNSDNVTTRMLLSNTSGIIRDWFSAFYVTGYEHYQGVMNGLLEWLPTREMSFEEGTMYEYANAGWTLLGILVARMTGHSNYFEGFAQQTSENIFAPLGMERSTFVFTDAMTNFARPYLAAGAQDVMTIVPTLSAGSLFSSSHDMARFMHAILGGGSLDGQRLLQQDTIEYMLQKHTPDDPSGHVFTDYGLGFGYMISADGFETVGHGGNTIHYHTEMIFNTESGLGVFVSTNTVAGALIANPVAITILQSALMEKTGHVPRIAVAESPVSIDPNAVPIELSPEELETFTQFEGIYSFGALGIWTLELIDGVFTWIGPEVYTLTPMSDGTFDSMFGRYQLIQTEDGTIALLHSEMGSLPGVRLDNIEDLMAPEGFTEWVGAYNFVPRLANEVPLIQAQLVVAINDLGIAMLQLVTPMGTQEVMLDRVGDAWFFAGMPIIFNLNEDGAASIDLMGAQFVRQ